MKSSPTEQPQKEARLQPSPRRRLPWLVGATASSRSIWRRAGSWCSNHYIDPDSSWKFRWDMLVAVATLYSLFLTPFLLSFGSPHGDAEVAFSWTDVALDFVFVADVFVTARTAIYLGFGELETDAWSIFLAYAKSWLVPDALASIPTEIILVIADAANSTTIGASQLRLLRLLRFFRILRFGRLFQFGKRLRSTNVMRLSRIFLGFLLLIHWMGCLFHAVPSFEAEIGGYPYSDVENGVVTSWLQHAGLLGASQAELYVASLYFSCVTAVTVGYGDILPITVMERLIVISMMVCGTVVYSLIFASLAALLSSLNTTEAAYSEFMSQVEGYMRSHRFPAPLQERILRFYEVKFEWQRSVHGEGFELLDNLPMLLQTQVAAATHARCFQKNPVLRGVPISFAQLLAIKLKQQISVPGEVLFSAGEPPTHLYIVSRGEVALVVKRKPRWDGGLSGDGAAFSPDNIPWQNGIAPAAAANFAPYGVASAGAPFASAAGGATTGLMAWRGSPASSVPATHAGVEMVPLARRPSKLLHREGGGAAASDLPAPAPHRSRSADSNATGVAASTPSHSVLSAPARRWAMVRQAVHTAALVARLRGLPMRAVLGAAFVEDHLHTHHPDAHRHHHAGTSETASGATSEHLIETRERRADVSDADASRGSAASTTFGERADEDETLVAASASLLPVAGVSTAPAPAGRASTDAAAVPGSGTASPASSTAASAAGAATVGRASATTLSAHTGATTVHSLPGEISHSASLSGGSQADGLGGHAGRVLRRMQAALRLQGQGVSGIGTTTSTGSPAVQATIGSVSGAKKPNKKDQKQRQKLLALYSQAAKERGGDTSHAEPRVEAVLRGAVAPHGHNVHASGGSATATLSGAPTSLSSRTPVVDSPLTPSKASFPLPVPGTPAARDASVGAFGTRSLNAHAVTLWQRALQRSHSQGSIPGRADAAATGQVHPAATAPDSTNLQLSAGFGSKAEAPSSLPSVPAPADGPSALLQGAAEGPRAAVPAPIPASSTMPLSMHNAAHSLPSSQPLVRSGSSRRMASTLTSSAVGVARSAELVSSQVASSTKAIEQLSNAQLTALLARGPAASPQARKGSGSGMVSPGSERSGGVRGREWRSRSRSVLDGVGSPQRRRGARVPSEALPTRDVAALRISAPRSGLSSSDAAECAAAASTAATTAVQLAASSDGLRDRKASAASQGKQAGATATAEAAAIDVTIAPPTGWAAEARSVVAAELNEAGPTGTEARLLQIADARHASMAREGRHIRTKRQVREHLAAVAALASTMEADEEILSWRRDGSYFGDEALFPPSGDSEVLTATPSALQAPAEAGINRRPTIAALHSNPHSRVALGANEEPHPMLFVEEDAPEDAHEMLHVVAAHSTTFCELFLLEAAEWHRLMELFPAQEATFHLLAAARYKRAVAAEFYDDTELSGNVLATAAAGTGSMGAHAPVG